MDRCWLRQFFEQAQGFLPKGPRDAGPLSVAQGGGHPPERRDVTPSHGSCQENGRGLVAVKVDVIGQGEWHGVFGSAQALACGSHVASPEGFVEGRRVDGVEDGLLDRKGWVLDQHVGEAWRGDQFVTTTEAVQSLDAQVSKVGRGDSALSRELVECGPGGCFTSSGQGGVELGQQASEWFGDVPQPGRPAGHDVLHQRKGRPQLRPVRRFLASLDHEGLVLACEACQCGFDGVAGVELRGIGVAIGAVCGPGECFNEVSDGDDLGSVGRDHIHLELVCVADVPGEDEQAVVPATKRLDEGLDGFAVLPGIVSGIEEVAKELFCPPSVAFRVIPACHGPLPHRSAKSSCACATSRPSTLYVTDSSLLPRPLTVKFMDPLSIQLRPHTVFSCTPGSRTTCNRCSSWTAVRSRSTNSSL